jgi:hypothetical protein
MTPDPPILTPTHIMPPEIYSDDNGHRVIVRHKGPAGKGFPTGGTVGQILAKTSGDDYDAQWVNPPDGTDAALGPVSAVNNNVAVFDGITGKLLKDGGQPLSNYASVSLVATKVDKVTGKGLSTEDFSTEEKSKLAALSPHYRGTYTSTALVASEVVAPVAGDYALVEVLGEPQQVSFWDETNDQWDHKIVEPMTGEEIATALFDTEDSAGYTQETCRIFTDDDKVFLEQIREYVNGPGGGGLTGAVSYVEKTASYAITKNDRTINCTSNSFTLTLPTAIADTGRVFVIKNSGSGIISVTTSDGIQTIDGDVTVELATQWEALSVQSTGSGWIII